LQDIGDVLVLKTPHNSFLMLAFYKYRPQQLVILEKDSANNPIHISLDKKFLNTELPYEFDLLQSESYLFLFLVHLHKNSFLTH